MKYDSFTHAGFFLFLIFLMGACVSSRTAMQRRDDSASIRAVLERQQEAWNRGDIEGFMQGYWKSKQLKFVGHSGLKYGWQRTLEGYKNGYPDREAMGTLHFEIESLEALGPDSFYMIGRYELIRKKDRPTGYFTLIWRRIQGKWKIISDMTCG